MNLKSKLRKKWLVLEAIGLKQTLLLPFALIFVLGLKFLTFFRDVQIHTVKNHRIGHFATNTELSRLSSNSTRETSERSQLNVYCFQTVQHSNSFLATMWTRELFLLKAPFGQLIYDLAHYILPKSIKKSVAFDKPGLLVYKSPSLTFNESELKKGEHFINQLEVVSEKGFVCLNVRDASYFEKTPSIGWSANRDWSYHEYRDSDIKTYIEAAESLTNLGYTVFRMGAIVKEPLVSAHLRVIDYATNGMRTEFLDIFLGAHCTFTISVGSGWDSVPTIFRRPMLWVNHLPIFDVCGLTIRVTVFPKILLDVQSKSVLSLKNVIDREIADRFNSQAYKDAGVEIRDLSSEELVEAVTEMAQRVEGTFVETPEQKEMQAKLKHILSTHPKLQPSPNYYPIRAQFASCFLSRYPNFLDGLD